MITMRPLVDQILKMTVDWRRPSAEAERLIGTLRGKHQGQTLAILASGPSLLAYRGDADVALAVNGAAFVDEPYQYFLCGDIVSAQRSWFTESSKFNAARIVSSFVAPFDPLLYPDATQRQTMQASLPIAAAAKTRRMSLLYKYEPSEKVSSPHLWFQYANPPISSFSEVPLGAANSRFFHGATIAGVALQLAVVMGVAELRLYGCDFSNVSGRDYWRPTTEKGGESTPLQRANFAKLLAVVERLGIKVFRAVA